LVTFIRLIVNSNDWDFTVLTMHHDQDLSNNSRSMFMCVRETHPQVEGWGFVYGRTQNEQWTGKCCKPLIPPILEPRSTSKDLQQQVIPSGHLSISLPSTLLPNFFCRSSSMVGVGAAKCTSETSETLPTSTRCKG
jgi:hypothetical protein